MNQTFPKSQKVLKFSLLSNYFHSHELYWIIHSNKRIFNSWVLPNTTYVTYQRRSPEKGGFTVVKPMRKNNRLRWVEYDNRWVVPYCPALTQKYGKINFLSKYKFFMRCTDQCWNLCVCKIGQIRVQSKLIQRTFLISNQCTIYLI